MLLREQEEQVEQDQVIAIACTRPQSLNEILLNFLSPRSLNIPSKVIVYISLAKLVGIVLQMKGMHIEKIVDFPFPTPPNRDSLNQAEKVVVYSNPLIISRSWNTLGPLIKIVVSHPSDDSCPPSHCILVTPR